MSILNTVSTAFSNPLVIGVVVAATTVVGLAFVARQMVGPVEEIVDEQIEREGDEVSMRPPDTKDSMFGFLLWYRHHKKQRRLAKKGYVKWKILGSNLSRPRWVKPSQDGSGTPRYFWKGDPYYFPKDALVLDETSGAYVAIHEKGNAMPLNLQDPPLPPMPVDYVQKLMDLEAESEKPGLFSRLDITPQKIMYFFIGFVLIFGFVMQVMGGP